MFDSIRPPRPSSLVVDLPRFPSLHVGHRSCACLLLLDYSTDCFPSIPLPHHATHSLAEELLAMGGVVRLGLRRLARSLHLNSTSSKTLIITGTSYHWRLSLLCWGPIPALALPTLFTHFIGV